MTAKVYHRDVWGTWEEKYEWLRTHTLFREPAVGKKRRRAKRFGSILWRILQTLPVPAHMLKPEQVVISDGMQSCLVSRVTKRSVYGRTIGRMGNVALGEHVLPGGWPDSCPANEFHVVSPSLLNEAVRKAGCYVKAQPPLIPAWVPLFRPDFWPDALLVPPDVYRGVCRTIVKIEGIHSLQAVSSLRFAVQVAAHLGEDAAAEWMAEDEARYLEALRVGLRPEEMEEVQ